MDFKNVTAHSLANIYFDGNVISHAITTAEGDKKSFGVIQPGTYHFGTSQAERMDIIDGSCSIVIDGDADTRSVEAGSHFEIEANSGFTITTESPTQYICSYL